MTWCSMTRSRSGLDEAARRWSLTRRPRRLNASLCGIRKEVQGAVLRSSARDVENMAARKEERSSRGKAVCRASEGGTRGRDMK